MAVAAVGGATAAFNTAYTRDEQPPYVQTAVLKQGSSGGEVKELQRRLKEWGYYNGAVDGIYDALIIELGSGTGDNWWCVIYPPLCFTSGTADVKYRSAIWDIINKFFK